MARTTQLPRISSTIFCNTRTVREMKPVVSFRFVSHALSLAIGFIGYCQREMAREVYVCMTLQNCQKGASSRWRSDWKRTKLATAHVLPVGKYRAKLPCEFGKLLAAGMLLRNGATSASPRVLVSALLRVALEGPRFFTLLLSGAHVGG